MIEYLKFYPYLCPFVVFPDKQIIEDTQYLTKTLISSEWKDPSYILLYSIIYKLYSILEIESNYKEDYRTISEDALIRSIKR